MSRIMSTMATRTVISTLAALVMTAALPQVGVAGTPEAGLWKVHPEKSKMGSDSATLAIERVAGVNPTSGRFVVVSKGNVYLVASAADAYGDNGVKLVDYASMMRSGKAVLIGTNARSTGLCGFRCQGGRSEPHITLTFKAVNTGRQAIKQMLASDGSSE